MSNVARAKAILESTGGGRGVTPGPWKVVGYGNIQPEEVGSHPPIGKVYGSANAQFVAAARSLVPELVAEVEDIQGRVGAARGALTAMRHSTMCSTFIDRAPESECDCDRGAVLSWLDFIAHGAPEGEQP